jgi:hypothetical protein
MSVRPVVVLGAGIVLVGTIALLLPLAAANALLAAGFGAMQIVAGIVIVRRHGG